MQCPQPVTRLCVLTLLLAAVTAGASEPDQEQPPPPEPAGDAIRAEWVPRSDLDEEQVKGLPTACCGRFIEPIRDDEYADADPDTAPTQIDAPSGLRRPGPGLLEIPGPVELLSGRRSSSASGSAFLDEEAETVDLQGDVRFREPGLMLHGEQALIDQAADTATLEQSGFIFYESGLHGQASRLHYDGDSGRITINNSALSRCEPGEELWVLQSRELEIDTEAGMAYASDVTLQLGGFPVLRYPYTLPFPIDDERASGFLAPSASTRSRGGLDIATPYYFNLAPHYDATVTPRLISERGLMVENEFRYLSEWSMNTLQANWMPDDSRYDPALADQRTDRSPPARSRWFLGIDHEGEPGEQLRSRIDYTAVSDRNYFRDMGSSGLNLDNRSHLNREGSLQWFNSNWQATARVQRIEIIDPIVGQRDINQPYNRMPEFSIRGSESLPGGLEFSLASGITRFDRDLARDRLSGTQIDNGALVNGQRSVLEASVSLPWRTPGTFIVPTLVHHSTRYDLKEQALGTDPEPQRGINQFSLDSGLILERPVDWQGAPYTQTLEPRLYYLYSEYEDQSGLPTFDFTQRYLGFEQLFRRNRFGGHDRIGDADQISAAVTTRFIDATGIERARAEIGQIFYFEDRRVTPQSPLQEWRVVQPLRRERSALVMRGGYDIAPDWSLQGELQWADQRGRIEEGAVALRYQRDRDHILNIAHRYRERADFDLDRPTNIDPQTNQTDISAVWPLNDNWRFIGRWNYDHSNNRNLESFAGVEYSDCCTTMRILARDWVNDYEFLDAEARPNRGIYFQLTLHGLGNVAGSGISDLLREGIPGFEEYPANE